MPTEEEKKIIEEAIKEGKVVVIIGRGEYKLRVEGPKDKIVVIERK